MTNITFKKLQLSDWRQFHSVDVDLHPRLTVLTGANGSGKSTLLNIFAQHFGWQRGYLATPRKRQSSDGYTYFQGFRVRRQLTEPPLSPQPFHKFGSIEYSNGRTGEIGAPTQDAVQYHLQVVNQAEVKGVYIPSHRPLPLYQPVANIPTNALSATQAYNNYFTESLQRFQGAFTSFGPTYRLKESLISMATFGAGNKFVQGNDAVLKAYTGFEEVLHQVLPPSLGFRGISIRTPDVVFITKTGEFMIDASSGGIMALVDLAWQIHLFSLRDDIREDGFVVTIDEPENHLHPSMQRSLMADLIKAFPKTQFIIATHSPFMVSAVRDSNVYVLDYKDESFEGGLAEDVGGGLSRSRNVASQKLDTVNKAGTANEILRSVLGVPATVPEWVEESLVNIVNEYRSIPINNESLDSLREQLKSLGFAELYPQALSELVRGK